MGLWLADLLVRVTLLLGMAAAIAVLLRHAPAAARHNVWLAALAGVLALPLAGALLPRFVVSLPVPPDLSVLMTSTQTVAAPVNLSLASRALHGNVQQDVQDVQQLGRPGPSALERVFMLHGPVTTENEASISGAGASAIEGDGSVPRLTAAQWFLVAWIAGALLLLGRLVAGLAIARRLAGRAEPVRDPIVMDIFDQVRSDLGVRREIRLLVSSRIAVPITWGWRRPIVMAPESSGGWSRERWRVVLLHEATHVRRRDWLSQLVAQAACVTQWFNPFVWLGACRLRLEGERACDERVIDAGTRASDYAEHLLEIASGCRSQGGVVPAALGMARRGQLENRLLSILHPSSRPRPVQPSRRLVSRAGHAATALVGLAALLMVGVRPAMTAAQSPPLLLLPPPAQSLSPSPSPTPAPVPSPQNAVPPAAPAGPVGPVGPVDQDAQGERRLDRQRQIATQSDQVDRARADLGEQYREALAQAREQGMAASEMWQEQLARAREQLEAAGWDDLDLDLDFDFDLDLDPSVFVQAPNVTPATVDERVANALVAALGDTEPDVREDAARALGRYRIAAAAGPLTRALEDESPEVREEAARALGRIRSPEAARGLMGALDDTEVDVREQAINALASLRSPDAVPALIQALKDPEPDIAESAARALGTIRDPSAIDGLLAAARHPEPEVAEAALRSLAMFNDPRTIDAFTTAMTHDHPEVRRMAIGILSRSRFITVVCRDGIDNDGDGLIDAADADCR